MLKGLPLPIDERRLAEATKRAVKAAGGLKVAEAEATISDSQIQRCYATDHPASISIRDAVRIDAIGAHEAGHPHILTTMASIIGAVVIMLPERGGSASSLQTSVLELTVELGDVAQAIGAAVASSSSGGADVTPKEAEIALEQVADMERGTARLRLQLERIVAGAKEPARTEPPT